MLENDKRVCLYVFPYLLFRRVNDKTHWLDVCVLAVMLITKHSGMLREHRITGNPYLCPWRERLHVLLVNAADSTYLHLVSGACHEAALSSTFLNSVLSP